MKALCLSTFHPVLRTSVVLLLPSSAGLITAAIYVKNHPMTVKKSLTVPGTRWWFKQFKPQFQSVLSARVVAAKRQGLGSDTNAFFKKLIFSQYSCLLSLEALRPLHPQSLNPKDIGEILQRTWLSWRTSIACISPLIDVSFLLVSIVS